MKINSLWAKIKQWFIDLAIELKDLFKKIWEGLNPDNLLPFLGKHFLYLIWILLVPIVLYSMAQGRELFTGLFDDTFFFSGFRASFLLVAYFAQAMAIILLPRPFFKKIKVLSSEEAAKAPEELRHWGNVRYQAALDNPSLTYLLSTLPVVMYGLVMIFVQIDRIPKWAWWLIVPTLIIAFICSAQFEKKWRHSIPKTLILLLVNVVICGILVSWFEKATPFWNYFIVGTCLMIQMALVGGLSKRIAENFRAATNADNPTASTGSLKTHRYDRLYLWNTIPVALLVAFYMTCPNLEAPSPTFMLLLLTTFYLIIMRLIASWYIFKLKCKGLCLSNVLFWAAIIFIFGVIFFLKSGIHDIRTIPVSTMQCKDRATLDEWFEAWWAENKFDTTAAEIPIYLVAAQGGGTRAALWTSEMLNRLEVESNYQFHKHCFAITSASGGSVGTGATLSLWRFVEENRPLVDSTLKSQNRPIDSLYLHFAKGTFQRNYLSGSFFEIFVCEIGSRFLFGKKDRDNRNYRLQKDHGLGFAAGLKRGFYEEDSRLNMRLYERLSLWDKGDAPMVRVDGFKVKNYAFLEYLSYWYKAPGKPKANLPLYLPISTNIQTGKASFSSPVKMDTMVFTDAIDVLDAVEKSDCERKDRTLSIIGATNLSELFPVMSAFTYIPCTGNFIDGGAYENMGLQVLQQIYFWLDQKRATDPRMAKVCVRVIYLINNQVETKNYPKRGRKSQVGAPLSHASSTTIDGRTTYFTKRMAYDLNARDSLYTLWLQAPEPDSAKLGIPLGRWLSRRSVRLSQARADSCEHEVIRIIEPLLKGGK